MGIGSDSGNGVSEGRVKDNKRFYFRGLSLCWGMCARYGIGKSAETRGRFSRPRGSRSYARGDAVCYVRSAMLCTGLFVCLWRKRGRITIWAIVKNVLLWMSIMKWAIGW